MDMAFGNSEFGRPFIAPPGVPADRLQILRTAFAQTMKDPGLVQEAEAAGHDPVSAIFPFQANGRALSMEAGDGGGFVRVVARKSDHRVVGLQAVGAHVSELSGEFAMSIEMGARLEDFSLEFLNMTERNFEEPK